MSKKVINKLMKELDIQSEVEKQDDTVTETRLAEMLQTDSYYKTDLGFVRFTEIGWNTIDQNMKHGVNYEEYQKYVVWEEGFAKIKVKTTINQEHFNKLTNS